MLPYWSMGTTVVLLGAASYTDIRWRRIPNVLTFPAIGVGLILHLVAGGWEGLLLSVSGTLLAPCLIVLMHGGKGPGMGDIKLAAALGSLLGPSLGTLAMLLSMIMGGLVAMAWMVNAWGGWGHGRLARVAGRLSRKKRSTPASSPEPNNLGAMTIPYGVAIALGTLLSLVVCLWTGTENWYFWFATVAAAR